MGEIVFNPGTSAFTITGPDNSAAALQIVGAGLSNQSGIMQTLMAPEYGTFLGLPRVKFKGNALAGDLVTLIASPLGGIRFQDSSGTDHAVIVGARESAVVFAGTSNAGSATITASGTDRASSYGCTVAFIFNSDAANATLIAEGGTGEGGGGTIDLTDDALGGLDRVQIFGNGTLLVSHNGPVTIGSLEGDGNVSLDIGALSIGSNGRNTVFSGVIQDFYLFDHSLIKLATALCICEGPAPTPEEPRLKAGCYWPKTALAPRWASIRFKSIPVPSEAKGLLPGK